MQSKRSDTDPLTSTCHTSHKTRNYQITRCRSNPKCGKKGLLSPNALRKMSRVLTISHLTHPFILNKALGIYVFWHDSLLYRPTAARLLSSQRCDWRNVY